MCYYELCVFLDFIEIKSKFCWLILNKNFGRYPFDYCGESDVWKYTFFVLWDMISFVVNELKLSIYIIYVENL